MKKRKIIFAILIIAWLYVIWGHSMQPAVESTTESGWYLDIAAKYIPFIHNNDDGMYIIRKAAHFTEYAILGVLLALEFSCFIKKGFYRFINPLMAAMSAALIDETIQLFVEGRSSQVMDVWIDSAGAACGILFLLAILRLCIRKRRYHSQLT